MTTRWNRRRLLLAGLGLVALAAQKAHAREEAASAPLGGPPAYAAEDLDWVDPTRDRAVPVRLYWPHAAETGTVPLVVFSHGIGGSRRGYSYIGRHLASEGIASLHVQHIGSDRQLWFGNVLQMVGRLREAAQPGEALNRVKDVRFALDRLLAERGAHIDRSRLVMAGHSYGANTSLLLAGVAIPGYEGLAEPRFAAAVFISAPPLHGVEQPQAALAAVQLPTLHITCEDDVIRIPGFFSEAKDRVQLFEQTGGPQPAPKWLAVFKGGSHSVFTDRSGTGGAVQNPRIKAATKELVAGFIREVFGAEPRALNQWQARNAGLLTDWRGR